ncbi:thioesterase II family protein [Kitasatospora sp. NPDC101155]|uniref:thioesterase II family protein n=1 Tax=Kitasatospora sp. NPDC101155 TaxID=3364097 RepID=UPI00382E0FB2
MTSTVTTDRLWIRRYHQAGPGAPTLVCLPHAGGSATFYFPMSRALAPGCDVVAVQYPGRQDRRSEPLVESIDELADQLLPVLRRTTDGPVAFFGHSMGASLAFELARRFEEAGTVPSALFVSARPAPSRHREGGTVHLGDDTELIAKLRELSGTDEQVLGDEELLRMALPAIRNDYKAAETYQYRPGAKLNCPVHVLIGTEDPMVTEEEAAAWSEHTTGGFSLDVHDGGHFYLVHHQARILRTIAERLNGA